MRPRGSRSRNVRASTVGTPSSSVSNQLDGVVTHDHVEPSW